MRPLLAALCLLGLGCAHLPELAPVPNDTRTEIIQRCEQAFPKRPWKATHTIFATLPFGYHGQLLGVVGVSDEGLRAILLSPEGLSLFDGLQSIADTGPVLRVRRAVPPFDRPDFSTALMADVASAYVAPTGPPRALGSYATGAKVCRWMPADGEAIDVEVDRAGPRTIRTFRNLHLTREIRLIGALRDGFFPEVDLIVPGGGGYSLEMRLVDHE
jgi:hypothetical protein